MIRTVQQAASSGVTWIDVTAPTSEELDVLAKEQGLHPMVVEDSLDPWHLPKFERIEDTTFMILRVYGERPERTGNTAQDMTRKIAIFSRGDTVITIHRATQPVCEQLERDHGRAHPNGDRCSPSCLLVALAHRVLESYDRPLEAAEETLNRFEAQLFDRRSRSPALAEVHALKGTVGTIRRLMWLSQQVLQKAVPSTERSAPLFQDLREAADHYLFYAEQLLEEAQNLIAMHLAVASHRTNDVMRILTVFSAFFLPLTFIVGVYGMNFEYMPELRRPWGYFAVLAGMAALSLGIWYWFRRRGWLGGVAEDGDR
jgi:magnesium transporter